MLVSAVYFPLERERNTDNLQHSLDTVKQIHVNIQHFKNKSLPDGLEKFIQFQDWTLSSKKTTIDAPQHVEHKQSMSK